VELDARPAGLVVDQRRRVARLQQCPGEPWRHAIAGPPQHLHRPLQILLGDEKVEVDHRPRRAVRVDRRREHRPLEDEEADAGLAERRVDPPQLRAAPQLLQRVAAVRRAQRLAHGRRQFRVAKADKKERMQLRRRDRQERLPVHVEPRRAAAENLEEEEPLPAVRLGNERQAIHRRRIVNSPPLWTSTSRSAGFSPFPRGR
jgi:hypothetical protein